MNAKSVDDYSWVRGANYVPTYAVNDVQIWLNYDESVIERELGFARKLKLNSIRIFLQSEVYRHSPDLLLDRFDNFLTQCAKHEIRAMPVLFDSCFGVSPSLESAEMWVANPGPDRMHSSEWPEAEIYIRGIMKRFAGDPRVLIWDVFNEPTSTWYYEIPEGRDEIWKFCRHFGNLVKELDPATPITVGVVGTDLDPVLDLVDVLSIHTYKRPIERFRNDICEARAVSQRTGKPLVVAECGAPGRDQPYEEVFRVLSEERTGFYFWEVMIGKYQFNTVHGIVYPDGTIRRKGQVEALVGSSDGFELRPDSNGVPITQDPPWEKVVFKAFKRIVRSETAPENFSEHSTLLEAISNGPIYWPVFGNLVGDGSEEVKARVAEARKRFRSGDEESACKEIALIYRELEFLIDFLSERP